MFFVILLYLLFASVFTTSKTALEYAQPFFLVGSRMLFAGILLLGYQFLFNRKEFSLSGKNFGKLILLSLFSIYLTNVFEFWGLKYLTSFKACFIYSLSPFISTLISYLVLKEKMSSKKWLGLFIGMLGFIPILLTSTSTEEQVGYLAFFSWAELAVVIATICSVYGWILLKQMVTEEGYSPPMANGLAMVLGGFFALIHSFLVEDWNPIPVTEFLPFLSCALILIIISNLICYNLYGYLLQRFSATFMSFAGLTTPLFTAFFGWLFLNEVVTWPFYASFCIVFSGVLIFYQEELRKELPVLAKNRMG